MYPEAPEYIQSLKPYVPGKPIDETQREFGLARVIKLASNENPLGPSPLAKARISEHALEELHRYPDSSAFHLKKALSEQLGVSPKHIIVGNGSNEIIELILRTYLEPGDQVVLSQGAFIAYRISAQAHGIEVLEAPLREDFTFDLDRMAALIENNPEAKAVFIPNPNNPTGTYSKEPELVSFLERVAGLNRPPLVVLDYAYWEYVTAADLPDPYALQKRFANVFVTQTFSKIYGLAALRLGYGVAVPSRIDFMERIRAPFNVSSIALEAGVAALSDESFVARSREVNEAGRKFWESGLKALGIPYLPTQGNFILVNTRAGLGKSGGDVFQACLRQGVIFRPVDNYGMPDYLRISFGTQEENETGLKALTATRSAP